MPSSRGKNQAAGSCFLSNQDYSKSSTSAHLKQRFAHTSNVVFNDVDWGSLMNVANTILEDAAANHASYLFIY